ncbi:hypothetical protein NA56DRAFT_699784 [Hyaloscypha hepaticicola]|uniref:Uncharacterized protein n=1 Tax=Hyaloscypha hepaticicola TaxID=2082293 RepID=A0A2J6QFD7_9HELO|nr:hypothetical protein NA56DRAFT_699784 [Hyaloscypha hepaticicola]
MMGVPGPQRTAAANASDSRSKFPSNYFAKGPRDKAVDDTDRKIPVQRACNWCVPHVFEYRYLEVKYITWSIHQTGSEGRKTINHEVQLRHSKLVAGAQPRRTAGLTCTRSASLRLSWVRLQPGAQFASLAKELVRWWTCEDAGQSARGTAHLLSPAFCPSQQRHIAHRPLSRWPSLPDCRGSNTQAFCEVQSGLVVGALPSTPNANEVITALAPICRAPKLPSFPDMRLRPIHIYNHHSHFIPIGRAIADIPTASSKTLVIEFWFLHHHQVADLCSCYYLVVHVLARISLHPAALPSLRPQGYAAT